MGSPIYRGGGSFKNWILTPRKTRNHQKRGVGGRPWGVLEPKNTFQIFAKSLMMSLIKKVMISHQGLVWLFLNVVHFNSSTDISNTAFTNTQYNLVLLF